MTTLPLARMTVDQVRAEVREVLSQDLDVDRLADFLASVDWSGTPAVGTPEVRDLLGVLEMATTEYCEGDRTRQDFVDLLHGIATQGLAPR